jgi:hypothetical protein
MKGRYGKPLGLPFLIFYRWLSFQNSGHIGIIVNESQSMVMFPMASKRGRLEEGEIDMNSGFYSTDNIFHEWCLDYFHHMMQITKPFNPNKLSEV